MKSVSLSQIVKFLIAWVLDSGIRPEETLFVDDGKNNIVVGQELGFHTYQPLNGEDWRGRLDEILSKS